MESDKIRPSSWVRRKTNWTTWRTIAVTKSVLANSHFSIFLVFYKCINWKLTKASQGIKKSWMIRKKRGKVNFEVFLLNSIDTGLEDPALYEQIIHPIHFSKYLQHRFAYFIFYGQKKTFIVCLCSEMAAISSRPPYASHMFTSQRYLMGGCWHTL